MNFKIKNEAGRAKVVIDGEIGQSWFDDGNTLKTVKLQLEGIEAEAVDVDIKSLGGDLLEAFAIYDLFRSMPQKVTATITGATASAGTLVAMGADEVNIMPNAKFLVHNSWTVTQGNSETHKEQAEALERFDNDIVDIYRKKTGKRKSELSALMKREKWLSAAEAKDWGFVDKIVKEKVNNLISNKMEKVSNYFGTADEDQIVEKAKAMAIELATVKAKFTEKEMEAEALKNQIAEINKQRNAQIVSNAIEAGKITEGERAAWLDILNGNFESGKAAIEALKKPGTIKDFLAGETPNNQERDYDWYVKNDAAGLLKMSKEQPEMYAKLIDNKNKKRRN